MPPPGKPHLAVVRAADEQPEIARPVRPRKGKRIAIATGLDALEHALRQIQESDHEAAHELRVACVKLRVWLRLGGWHVLVDDLRWLRRAAARVRDLDVHLARHPPAGVRGRLASARLAAHRRLLDTLADPRIDAILVALSLLPAIPRRRARSHLEKMVRAVLHDGRRAAARPRDPLAWHALRSRVRQLRFALEWMGLPARRALALQDALGPVGDQLAALRHVAGPEAEGAAGTHAEYRRGVKEDLRKAMKEAQRAWRSARPHIERMVRWTSS